MYQHILFATDLSDDIEHLIKKVRNLRGYTGAHLSLVHVIELPPAYGYAYAGIEDIEQQLIEEAKKGLARVGASLAVENKHQHVKMGPTKLRIHSVAEEVGADLIVVGSHGRHGLSLLLGSTANAVLHGATCDVLVVRLPE